MKDDASRQANARKIINMGTMENKLLRFKALADDMSGCVELAPAKEILGEVVRVKALLEKNLGETTWAMDETKASIAAAKVLQEAQAGMHASLSKHLQEVAAGMPDLWDQGIAQGASWETVLKKARETLLAQEKSWCFQALGAIFASCCAQQALSPQNSHSRSCR